MRKTCGITGRYGSIRFFGRYITAAPMSDRRFRLPIVQKEPTPVRLIGPTLRSFLHIDELTPGAWCFGPPRVDLPM